MQHLRTERRADELAVRRVRDGLEHLRDRRPVLRVQVGVDFIKKVEWCGIACLDGKDKGQRAKT